MINSFARLITSRAVISRKKNDQDEIIDLDQHQPGFSSQDKNSIEQATAKPLELYHMQPYTNQSILVDFSGAEQGRESEKAKQSSSESHSVSVNVPHTSTSYLSEEWANKRDTKIQRSSSFNQSNILLQNTETEQNMTKHKAEEPNDSSSYLNPFFRWKSNKAIKNKKTANQVIANSSFMKLFEHIQRLIVFNEELEKSKNITRNLFVEGSKHQEVEGSDVESKTENNLDTNGDVSLITFDEEVTEPSVFNMEDVQRTRKSNDLISFDNGNDMFGDDLSIRCEQNEKSIQSIFEFTSTDTSLYSNRSSGIKVQYNNEEVTDQIQNKQTTESTILLDLQNLQTSDDDLLIFSNENEERSIITASRNEERTTSNRKFNSKPKKFRKVDLSDETNEDIKTKQDIRRTITNVPQNDNFFSQDSSLLVFQAISSPSSPNLLYTHIERERNKSCSTPQTPITIDLDPFEPLEIEKVAVPQKMNIFSNNPNEMSKNTFKCGQSREGQKVNLNTSNNKYSSSKKTPKNTVHVSPKNNSPHPNNSFVENIRDRVLVTLKSFHRSNKPVSRCIEKTKVFIPVEEKVVAEKLEEQIASLVENNLEKFDKPQSMCVIVQEIDAYLNFLTESTEPEAKPKISYHFLELIIKCLPFVSFELRKRLRILFVKLLDKTKFASCERTLTNVIDSLSRNCPNILESILNVFECFQMPFVIGDMIRALIQHKQIIELIYQKHSKQLYPLMNYIEERKFDISSNAFECVRQIIFNHEEVTIKFFTEYFDSFFQNFIRLLESTNFAAKLQAIGLLYDILVNKGFSEVTPKFIQSEYYLLTINKLLLQNMQNVRCEAFQIFKLFVMNTNRDITIERVLISEKQKLTDSLETLLPKDDSFEDELDIQFRNEINIVIQTINDIKA